MNEATEMKFRASLPMNVQEAMRQNLPSEVGQLLRQQLEEGDAAIAENSSLRAELVKIASALREDNVRKVEIETLEKERAALKKERGEVERLKRDHVRMKLETELAAEKRITAILSATLSGLVRNTTFKETVFGSQGTWTKDGYITGSSAPHNATTERVAE
jgi:hypothetical protein